MGCLMSFAHTQWDIYSTYCRDLDPLNAEAGEQQSIFRLVSILFFREYLLDSVMLSLMVNKAALTCQLSCSTVQIGLLPFWELRDSCRPLFSYIPFFVSFYLFTFFELDCLIYFQILSPQRQGLCLGWFYGEHSAYCGGCYKHAICANLKFSFRLSVLFFVFSWLQKSELEQSIKYTFLWTFTGPVLIQGQCLIIYL